MTESLVILVLVAMVIPIVVMGALWLVGRAMDRMAGSRKARIAIPVAGLVVWVAMAANELVEGRRFWWLTALGTALWIAMVFMELRRPDPGKEPADRIRA